MKNSNKLKGTYTECLN